MKTTVATMGSEGRIPAVGGYKALKILTREVIVVDVFEFAFLYKMYGT
jgi:hypothetical protein